jgi:hypothetical protein
MSAHSWSVASYWSARAAEERAYAAMARSQARRFERLALAERWERRAKEMDPRRNLLPDDEGC